MARSSNYRKGTGRKTYAIIVDGETEMWYLQMLRRNESIPGISIQPELPKKKSLKDQYDAVKLNAGIYDSSIWVLDLDIVIAIQGAVQELKGYLQAFEKMENVHVLINTPCLEFWFLQHVKDAGNFYALCDPVSREFKKYDPLKDYEKSEKYFVQSGLDIYKRLKPHLKNGIANAAKRGDFDFDNPKQAKAELYKVFAILGIAP